MLGIGSGAAAAALIAVFVIYDYPRKSGLTDVLGLTCGEYVQIGDPHAVPAPLEQWEAHRQALAEAEDLDGEGVLAAVELLATAVGAQPLMGQFHEALTQREISATVAGADLVIGHHDQSWSRTDRVSVFDVQTREVTWTAELTHPVHDPSLAGEERPQLLYGVGTAEGLVVLQTPTYRGDTDLVIADPSSDSGKDCVRLDGAVDTLEVLSAQPEPVRAWSQTLNLNAGQPSGHELLVHHGVHSGSPQHTLSVLDVPAAEAQPATRHRHDFFDPAEQIDIPEEAYQAVRHDLERLTRLGESHYLLTWEAGYVLLGST